MLFLENDPEYQIHVTPSGEKIPNLADFIRANRYKSNSKDVEKHSNFESWTVFLKTTNETSILGFDSKVIYTYTLEAFSLTDSITYTDNVFLWNT